MSMAKVCITFGGDLRERSHAHRSYVEEKYVNSESGCTGDRTEGDFAPLPETLSLSIQALSASSDNTVLGRSLRQVIRSLKDPDGVISAFDSFASRQ